MTLEIDTQRRLTKAFINTQPVQVTLIPRSRIKQPSGGIKWQEEAPRPEQTMRLIEPGSIPLPTVTLDGVQREVEFELLGEWDAVIGQYDIFTLPGGHRWEVLSLGHFNGWEQRALVSRVG